MCKNTLIHLCFKYYLTKTCFPFAVFWWLLPMAYSTYRINPSLWRTTGIWCLLWCFSNGRAMLRAGDQNPNRRGRTGWAEMRQLLLCCKLSSAGTRPRSACSLQTAYGGEPEAQTRIRPTGPCTPSCKVCLLWSNVRYLKDFSDCRTENAYGRRLLPSIPIYCVFEEDPTHT